jgi:protein TonB
MNIFITKNGQQIGPYSLQELNARLALDEISGDDLCWYEGCEDWIPVSQLPGFAPSGSKQEPPPLPKAQPQKEAHELTSTVSSNGQWYYSQQEMKIGPHVLNEVIKLIRANLLQRDVLVWHGGMKEWAPAYQTELSKYFDEAANRSANDSVPLSSVMPLLTSESSKQASSNENERKQPSPWGAVALALSGLILLVPIPYFALVFIAPLTVIIAILAICHKSVLAGVISICVSIGAFKFIAQQNDKIKILTKEYSSSAEQVSQSDESGGFPIERDAAKIADHDTAQTANILNKELSGFRNLNVERVRNGTMALDPTRTIGDALERSACFDKVSWRSFTDDNGRDIVEFRGECNKFLERLNKSLESDPENIFELKIYDILMGQGELESLSMLAKKGIKLRNSSLAIKFAFNKRYEEKFEIVSESMRMELVGPKGSKMFLIDSDNDPFLRVVFERLGGSQKQSLITKLYGGLSNDDFNLMTLCILYAECKILNENEEKKSAEAKASASLGNSTPATIITSGTPDHALASPTQKGELYTVPLKAPPVPKSGYLPPTGENSGKDTGLDKSIDPSNQPTMPSAKSTSATTNLAGKNAKASYVVRPIASYPPESRTAGEQGVVTLRLTVDGNGRPTAVSIVKSSGFPRLDRAAVEAGWRSRVRDAAAGSHLDAPVRFNLSDR